VFELQDRVQEDRVVGGPDLPRHSKTIEFRHVSFRYPGGTEALKDVSLTIQAGEVVAVVGPNGSGKTTLVQMIPRLIDPAAGEVLIDGHDLRKVSMRSLRRQVGIVTQDTVLFNATIGENIGYGRARPKERDVMAAAKRAFVDEFVQPLPAKYDTMIGEHGTGLSGGQRQRIAIARAILRDPTVLIFDEATSQIDADSEHRIHQAMADFIHGRTALIVAHRFATVLSADRIVVMNEGQITDVGTHKELLGRCKLYEHLYRTQFSDAGG
jgi:ABC-type multidrug transport system fused ATPase/permease subunit